ncbi:sulfotransferase family protein [Actinoplanes sp. NPDC049265]|uniref:sulfotransferase family protein n=1 Tax=Actinoplanes sp. NPDC049265 TaxID=3363902 RepID=UPI003710A973
MRVDGLRRAVRSSRAYGKAVLPLPLGRLPEFLIVGGQRCGTTSLYRYLAAHPSVRPATGKELQFFSLHHGRGERWYRAHFPVRPPGIRSFEASPYYLFDPGAAARAAAMLPGSRFVALIRDPAERAYSHYLHSVAYGVESLPFAEALDAEPARLAAGGHDARRRYSYVARGKYAGQLTRWFDAAGRDRVLVLRTEELTARYAEVLAFLGLEPRPVPAERHTRRAAGAPPLDERLRERLDAEFADDRREVDRLLAEH